MVRSWFPSPQLLATVDQWPRSTELATTGYQEPSLVWYSRRRLDKTVRFLDESAVADFLAQPGPRACVLGRDEYERWIAAPADPGRRTLKTTAVEGWNLVHGRRVQLVLVCRDK